MEQDIRSIYEKFLAGQCSQAELVRLLAHFGNDRDEGLHDRIEHILEHNEALTPEELSAMAPVLRDNWSLIKDRLQSEKSQNQRITPWFYWRSIAAAMVVLCSLVLIWYVFERDGDAERSMMTEIHLHPGEVEDAKPGRDQAVLILSDGTRILLDSIREDSELLADGMRIQKKLDGTLTYLMDNTDMTHTTAKQHTISTPKGGTINLKLPDGSTVWLNADATLQFPVSFDKNRRQVLLEGEAYFDVVEDYSRPFVVALGEQRITVLGTSFNVSAYPGEIPSTTLVTGRVRLNQGEAHGILSPGQRAQWIGQKFDITNVDVAPYIAWKTGWFIFQDLSMQEILPQLARWYDVQIDTTEFQLRSSRFYYGEISRDVPLSEVLEMLASDGSVQFELKGGVLHVK